MIAADYTGQLRDSKQLLFADYIIDIKNKEGRWAVIDKIVDYWIKTNPKKYDSFVIDVDEKRDSRATRYGSNRSKSIRSTMDVPTKIIQMIRSVYKADELPMDKKFFDEMWKRYPFMRVAERL